MTYALFEASSSEGRPYFLYQFVEGDLVWRFTSRAEAWTSTGSGGETLTWEPAAVAHGDVVQTSEIERGRLELTWPLSHPFARRFLAPLGTTPAAWSGPKLRGSASCYRWSRSSARCAAPGCGRSTSASAAMRITGAVVGSRLPRSGKPAR